MEVLELRVTVVLPSWMQKPIEFMASYGDVTSTGVLVLESHSSLLLLISLTTSKRNADCSVVLSCLRPETKRTVMPPTLLVDGVMT